MKSASSDKDLSLFKKTIYSFKLLAMRLKGSSNYNIIPWDNIKEYEAIVSKYSLNRNLINNQILEIGFGARPWRLISLCSLGYDVKGIDLDEPTYGFNINRLLNVLKKNGIERFLKSFVRGLFFDTKDIKKLKDELKKLNKVIIVDKTKMIVGNASNASLFPANSFTFAYSEDVFEHIPQSDISNIMHNLSIWLEKDALAVIRPHIYTGISGGHSPEWYPHKVKSNSSPLAEAWNHLLNPNFKVNTYLNKLRINDYINLFSKNFEILEIIKIDYNLGENYLTDSLKEKLLIEYSFEEIMTNNVAFILKNKKE